VSVYLANVLVPASDRVDVTNQRRDYNQRELDVDYVLRNEAGRHPTEGNIVKTLLLGITVLALVAGLAARPAPGASPTPPAAADAQRPIQVYIRAGLKSHGEGQHDYPQFLADWSKVLTEHGALVDGGLHFPDSRELADTDVMVMYKGDAGYMTAEEKAVLET